MQNKVATTTEPIADLLARRWSPRAFEADRAISSGTLVSLFEAARWAPSCFNEQPWRYLVCDRFREEESWRKALGCLVDGNQTWAVRAPVLIAAIADTLFSRSGKPNRWCEYDTGAASENLCLQATHLGLAVHQMGGFDRDGIVECFHIPERYEPVAMIALGYPGNPNSLSERQRETEFGDRSRHPIDDFVFLDEWHQSLTNTS